MQIAREEMGRLQSQGLGRLRLCIREIRSRGRIMVLQPVRAGTRGSSQPGELIFSSGFLGCETASQVMAHTYGLKGEMTLRAGFCLANTREIGHSPNLAECLTFLGNQSRTSNSCRIIL